MLYYHDFNKYFYPTKNICYYILLIFILYLDPSVGVDLSQFNSSTPSLLSGLFHPHSSSSKAQSPGPGAATLTGINTGLYILIR